MSNKELLLSEIEQVSEPLLGEVLDFVRFLKTKKAGKLKPADLTIASESSLKKVWLTPEEDEAWKDL
ncbi:MAG: DUF2281 domain-containing protein [Nitrospinales bacterium]